MKPINSRERSKQLWQFVFIFFALAVIPVALIFFSYYHVPEEISEAENRKIMDWSKASHTQKIILTKMSQVDSNINLYATSTTENPRMLEKRIADGIEDLKKLDTSSGIVQLVSIGYEHHYTHVLELLKKHDELKSLSKDLEDCKTNEGKLKAALSNPMMLPPVQSTQ